MSNRKRTTCRSTRVHSRVTRKPHACDARTCIYSIYTQASPTSKESGGLGYEASVSTAHESRAHVRVLAYSILARVLEYPRVRVRVLACIGASTRVCVFEYSRACIPVLMLSMQNQRLPEKSPNTSPRYNRYFLCRVTSEFKPVTNFDALLHKEA